MSAERLTVIVAARNEAETLPRLHPRIAATLRRLEGIDGRVLYVDDGSIVGVPILWGSPAPTRLLAVRTPPVVAAVALVFDELWHLADRWEEPEHPWMPVLGLMGQGLTDDAIGQRLGLTDRTVRRRIAEAMAELGVSSRFALGMAWQRVSER